MAHKRVQKRCLILRLNISNRAPQNYLVDKRNAFRRWSTVSSDIGVARKFLFGESSNVNPASKGFCTFFWYILMESCDDSKSTYRYHTAHYESANVTMMAAGWACKQCRKVEKISRGFLKPRLLATPCEALCCPYESRYGKIYEKQI